MQTNQAAALGAQLRPTEDEIAEAIYMPLFRHLMETKYPMNFHDREDIAAKAAQQTVAAIARRPLPPPYLDCDGKLTDHVLHLAYIIRKHRLFDYLRRPAPANISLCALLESEDGGGDDESPSDTQPLSYDRTAPSPASIVEREDLERICCAATAARDGTAHSAMLIRLESGGEASDRAIARRLGLSARGIGKANARLRDFLVHTFGV